MAEPWIDGKDPAYEPKGARFHEGQKAPLGLVHRLPAAPFEQNINIGGPTYSAVPPQRSGLTVDEQNVTVPTNPLGWFGQFAFPGAYAPMSANMMEEIETAEKHDLTPGSWMHRVGTDEWQGGWDAIDAGFDLADLFPGLGIGGMIFGGAVDIGQAVGPIAAKKLLKPRQIGDFASGQPVSSVGARGKGDALPGDNTLRIIPEGSRVLETVTEKGKFRIQDVSDDAMKEAQDIVNNPSEYETAMKEFEDVGIPARHQFPRTQMELSTVSRMRELDVTDADGNALMRVFARPDYDVVARADNYIDFQDWIEDIAEFAPGDQAKAYPMIDGVEIDIPTMEQIWPDRPWHVDVKGFKPQDQVDQNLFDKQKFWDRDVEDLMHEADVRGLKKPTQKEITEHLGERPEWDKFNEMQYTVGWTDTSAKGQTIGLRDQAEIWEGLMTRVNASKMWGIRLPNEGKGARVQGKDIGIVDRFTGTGDTVYRKQQTQPMTDAQKDLLNRYISDSGGWIEQ